MKPLPLIRSSTYTILISLLSLLLFLPATNATDPPSPSTTIIDILSSSPQFSILLHHLQKHGLVNLINQSRNSTFIAPVNGAFYKLNENELSNVITRDVLLYHFLNGTVISDDISSDIVLQSHLTKDSDGETTDNGIPVIISPTDSDDSEDNSTTLIINGVAQVVEPDLIAGYQRGVVQGIDSVLNIPPRLCDVIQNKTHDSSFFSELFSLEYKCHSKKSKKDILKDKLITVLLPNNPAFDQFNDIEKSYLLSENGHSDRKIIINRHIVPHLLNPQSCLISDNHDSSTSDVTSLSATTVDGTTLLFDGNYTINSTLKPDDINILTRDGLIYTYDSLISTPKDCSSKVVDFTPEKYLYGLNADQFVTETYLRGQQSFINGSETEPQTIFVYPMSSSESDNHPNIRYHFVKGVHALKHLRKPGTYLLDSKLSSRRMSDYYQKIKVTITSQGKTLLNSQSVISSDYTIGNTSIYLLDGDLDVPPSLSSALGPFFQSSFSVGFLESTGLLFPPKNEEPRTYLVPSRRAWENQHLVQKYLQTNETALIAVFESLIFETPLYTNEPPRTLKALDGSESVVGIFSGGEYHHNGPYFVSVDNTSYDIDAEDILFNSGVAHSIDQLSVPKKVAISPRDLIQAGGRSTFIDLLDARNLSYILNSNESYTILVPNMQNLADNGYSLESRDIDELLSLHILPGNPINSLLGGEPTQTLDEDVELSGRNVTENFHFITIVDGTGQETYVVSRGDAQNYEYGKHSTILFLDRYISPDWINKPFRPPFRLKTHVAILIGAALGLILAATAIVTCLYAFVGTRKLSQDEDDERRPLLQDGSVSPRDHHSIRSTRSNRSARSNRSPGSRNHSRHNSSGGTSPTGNDNFYSTISSNSSANPIATTHVNEHREFGRHLNLPG